MEKNYFAAIEFGSLYNNVLILSYNKDKFDVVACLKSKSDGFYNGKVTDEDAFIYSITLLMDEVLQKYKIVLDEVILVLPNNNHRIYSAKFANKVLTERQIIGKAQIDAIRRQARNVVVNADEVLVDEVPTVYTLDDNRVLRTPPINYQSSILEIRSSIHTLPKEIVLSIKNALNAKHIDLLGHYINAHCGAVATVKNYELESQCIHVNINQDVTTVSAFTKNLLIRSTIVDFGLNDLVTYLASNLSVSKQEAHELLQSYFICNIDYTSDVIFDHERNLSERRISGILLNKLYESFDVIKQAILNIANECRFIDDYNVVLTGCLNDYEFFIEEFINNTSINVNEGIIEQIGIIDQSFINCYGAIMLFVENNKEYVINRLENEVEEIIQNNVEEASSLQVNQTKSRFKDVFDD